MAGYVIRRNFKKDTADIMKIYPHWTHFSGILTEDDVQDISETLNIPPTLWKGFTKDSGTQLFTLKTPDNTELASIMIPPSGKHGSALLRGDFFDTYPDQSIKDFINFMYSKAGNCLRLDISFKDTSGILAFDDYKRMSKLENYLDYCTGTATVSRKKKRLRKDPDSTNRGGVPDVHDNHRWIQYGDSDSSSCAKFYECQDGFNKFEITLKNKSQTKVLMDAYNPGDMTVFNDRAKEALVKTINFIKPASKRAKRPVQVESFEKFLGSKVLPIRWTTHSPEKQDLTLLDSFLLWKSGIYNSLWRGIERFKLPYNDIEAIAQEMEDRLTMPG